MGVDVPGWSFAVAVLITTLSILSMGFVIASIVPTARFAQPIGAIVFYPMLAVSGLFIPMQIMPAWLRFLPLANAVSLLQGIWKGEAWSLHVFEIVALSAVLVICTALSSRVFRWE